jgi:hypothetical protein
MTKQLLIATVFTVLSVSLGGLRAEIKGATSDAGSKELIFRIYDYAGLEADVLVEAAKLAREIYVHSGVATRWIQCPTPNRENPTEIAMYDASCEGPVGTDVIQMRVMPNASKKLTALGVNRLVFGFALPSTTGGFGTAATVFMDRVVRTAGLSNVTEASLLATVMAHEAGHLLLGMNSHSNYGLMSAVWEEAEFSKIAEGSFRFFGREKKMIAKNARARLKVSGPPTRQLD